MPLHLVSSYSGPNGGLWQVFWYPRNQVAIDYAKQQTHRVDYAKQQTHRATPKDKAKGKSIGAKQTKLQKKPAGMKKDYSKQKPRSGVRGKTIKAE